MDNNITIEKIDAVIARIPNTTYSQAKEALVECKGDVIEAVILLESKKSIGKTTKQVKQKIEGVLNKDNEDMKELKEQLGEDFNNVKDQAKELIKRSSVIRVIIEKNGKVIINIPLTVGVLGVALLPIYSLVGLSAAVITKYRIKIQNEGDGSVVDLGELNEEKINMLKQMITSTAKDVKDAVVESKNDDKDITDELINETEQDDINKM